MKSALLQCLKRLAIPLVFWETVNILIEILKQLFIQDVSVNEVVKNVVQSIIFYPYGALWYVQALIVALFLVALALNRDRLKTCISISLLLYLVGLLANTYYFVIEGTAIQNSVDVYLNIFVSARNGIFVGLFFVAVGVWIANHIKYHSKKSLICVTAIAYVAFVAEVCVTKEFDSADDKSMYLMFVVLIPAMFMCIAKISLKIRKAKLLRSLSTGIYFMHKAMIHVWLVVAMELKLTLKPTVEFVCILLSCVSICLVAYRIDNKKLNMLVK